MSVSPLSPGLYLGRGCDRASGLNYGEALDFLPAQPIIDGGGGQQVAFDLRQITSSQELMQSFNLTASASFSGALDISAEAKYASQQQINQYHTYLLISVRVTNPELVIRSPKLKPEAFELLQTQGWDAFEQQYGADYLAGLISGGSYYALIEIKTRDKTEQQDISAAVSASYGIFKGDVKAENKLKEVIKNKELTVKILQSGGSSDVLEVELDDMIQQAKEFPAVALQHPVPFLGVYEEYSKTVPLPPAIGDGPLSRLHRLNVLEELGHRYLSYKDYRSNLAYVLQNMRAFPEHLELSDDELNAKRQRYETDFQQISEQMNALERQARLCRNPAETCELPTEYYAPIEPLPLLEGENMLLKSLQEELNKLKLQVEQLQPVGNAIEVSNKSVGIGTAHPKAKLHVDEDLVLGNDIAGQKFIFHSRSNGHGDFLQITSDGTGGQWDWNNGITLRRSGSVGIGTPFPKATLDIDGELRIRGQQPIHIHEYKGNHLDTGYNSRDWVATIAGFRALSGDIEEDDTGNIIQVYTYVRDGKWWYFADFRSHKSHETFIVWVMFIRQELVSA